MEPDELIGLHSVYHEAIENAEKDPYHYGFRLPHWSKAEEQLFEVNEILALGGNRSGKTQWGAFSVVRAAIENPKSEIFCFAQTSEVSIQRTSRPSRQARTPTSPTRRRLASRTHR